jgi:uncharacterized protein YkwD
MQAFVRARSCAVVLTIALAASASAWAGTSGGARQLTSSSSLDDAILLAVNSTREEHGLTPVRLSPQLAAAAHRHSVEMAETGLFRHDSPGGGAFWKRIAQYYESAGFHSWSVGENILWSSPDVTGTGAVRLWLQSPRHRAILLDRDWNEVGLSAVHAAAAPGAFDGREVTIVTADFGARAR